MKYITHLLTAIILTVSTLSHAQQTVESVNVLFIGNSFTGANYLPTVLKQIATANNKHITFGTEIKGGTSLYQHWQAGKAQAKITTGTWDYVILQDSSASAFEHPDETLKYGNDFAQLIKQQGAKALLFNTWAYQGIPTWLDEIKDEQEKAGLMQFIPTMYQATNRLYQQLAQITNSKVVPVGQVWHRLMAIDPEVILHAKDKSHPSTLGTYLTAIVFYQALFNELPKVLPEKLENQRDQIRTNEMITIEVPKTLSVKMLTAVKETV